MIVLVDKKVIKIPQKKFCCFEEYNYHHDFRNYSKNIKINIQLYCLIIWSIDTQEKTKANKVSGVGKNKMT